MTAPDKSPTAGRRWSPGKFLFHRRTVGIALAIALVLHVYATSVQTVGQTEQGVVLRFGKVNRVVPAGFHLILPYPIETLERVMTTEVRIMSVGFRVADDQVGIEPSEDEVQWLTGDTNIIDLRVVVQYVVKDPVEYLYGVAALPDGRIRDFALRAIAEGVLTDLVARMEVDDVLSVGKAKLQADTRPALQEALDRLRLGVSVLAVNIVEANPPGVVNPAFIDVSNAKADKARALDEAEGYRRDLLPRERARANDILQEAKIYRGEAVNRAKGAAQKFVALAEKVRQSPEVSRMRLWLDTVSATLGRCETIVYPATPGRKFDLTTVE